MPLSEHLPRTALVTGAGQRIGRTIALDLAGRGFAVAVHYNRSAEAAAAVVAEIRAQGGKAVALEADLAREASVELLVPAAVGALGPLGVLVNNASTFEYDSVATATRAGWDRHMEANLRAPFVLMQAFASQLPEEAEGAVINLIDQRVWNLTPHFVTYTVSKAGLWTLTQTMALALAPRIRVNGIGPGPTLPSTHQTAAQFAQQCADMPLGHGTSPEEIAEAVWFLLQARAMTGQMLALDGGQHLGWAQPKQSISVVD
ncbi:short chain dehydrogenase [Aliidongia dinghuensis]|uniref:Short chain dehydrogenase n=1 Tax=Aliidongia dinghuensis TaxID=1867774 RepID=A0A8J3E7M9_9PROT|nr:SDR family oxidoreductase [Aliidongia dinghuensis]GGF45477.1 short chain dehydrogenase [Aliidongia dinghuensis]